MHPPPQNDQGWFNFLSECLVLPEIFPQENVDFVGGIRTGTPRNFFVITTQTQFQQSQHYLIIMIGGLSVL